MVGDVPGDRDERNASTSATAWTAYALHRQLKKNLIAPEQRGKVEGRGQERSRMADRTRATG